MAAYVIVTAGNNPLIIGISLTV